MNSMIKIGLCLGFAASLAACASTPADPDLQRTFIPVQAHQTADINLSCTDLKTQITDTETSVSILDKQIKHDQDQSQSLSMAAVFSSVSGAMANNPLSAQLANANATLGNAGAAMTDKQAMSKAQLRANIEQRHDTLMSVYYARHCNAS
jgi:hypothetical protein